MEVLEQAGVLGVGSLAMPVGASRCCWVLCTPAGHEAKLEVPIAATYALGEAAEAHKRLTGHVLGKIVLRVH